MDLLERMAEACWNGQPHATLWSEFVFLQPKMADEWRAGMKAALAIVQGDIEAAYDEVLKARGEWISTREKLPPANVQVMVAGPGCQQLVGGVLMEITIWDGAIWWDEGGTELSMHPGWTHWMHLPPSPIAKKKA